MFTYSAAGHVISGNLKIISGSRIRKIVSKVPKHRFTNHIASALNDCIVIDGVNESLLKPSALKEWKLNINFIDKRIKFYSQNNTLLPPKPKTTFRYLF